jgi:arylsulfatase A-like enzyme
MGVTLGVCTVLCGCTSPPKPLNILFVFTDDHASQAISAYGSRINQTPNIDRLAREGMLFRNCFVTNSICAPSRAVILTGKHSHINGVIDNRAIFDASQPTVARMLGEAGYQTAMIGKWHLKSEPVGFDYWEVLPGQGSYYNPRFRTPEGEAKYTGYTTHIITDLALAWLKEKRDPNRPFFLMYQHKAPHRNWQPGPEYLTLYDDQEIPESDTLFDDYSGRGSAARSQEMTIANHMFPTDLKLEPPNNLTEEQLRMWNEAYDPKNQAFLAEGLEGDALVRWKYQRYLKDYLRCVAAVDDDLGKVLDYLDEEGLAENTVVIYSSDQGFYLGEHGWYDKRFMYEESLRMPLIVRWPGVTRPGSVDEHLVQNLDFAPTFLEMAGAQVPADMQGSSLVSLLKGMVPEDWRESVYYHYYEYPGYHSVRRHYGVRTQQHKLIHFYNLGEWELYDLGQDPREMQSVYEDPAYADVVEELKGELARLRELYNVPETDPIPRTEP